MSPPIVLSVAGKNYGGWQTVRITRSIEALAGSFSIALTEQWAGQSKPWPIADDAECSVMIDGLTVITGFVDRTRPGFTLNSRSISVEGRDRSGDVVDCSAQLDKWSFSNVNVLETARKICAPYGVNVSLQPGLVVPAVTVPKKHAIDPGDSAADALQKLLAPAGLLAVADGNGGLVLSRAGSQQLLTTLVEGENVKEAQGSFDVSSRFRTYEVMGSHKGRDDLSGATAAGVRGTATDMNARTGRTLIVRPDTNMTAALAKDRAEWEASTRAARGESVAVKVQGWAPVSDALFHPVWPMNWLVRAKLPSCRVNGLGLIAGVSLSHDDKEGTVTTLDLRNPDAFAPDPTIARAGAGGNHYWREIVRGV